MEKGVIERRLLPKTIVGVDEVGKGCLAGPVYAAAVIIDWPKLFALDPKHLKLIRDSKTLSEPQRLKILPVIASVTLESGVGFCTSTEIDTLGISPATHLAMRRALKLLHSPVDVLLIDGNQNLSAYNGPQQAIVKGDSFCFSIAAASIIAKVSRDQVMKDLHEQWPDYGFDRHKGYGTQMHRDQISSIGPCPDHRMSFAPMRYSFRPSSMN